MLDTANLVVENNIFDLTFIPANEHAFGTIIINIDNNENITVGKGHVRVTGNIATGSVAYDYKNHLSQIYAINDTNDAAPIFKGTSGQKADGANFYVTDIIFSISNGSGVVYDKWTRDTVDGWTSNLFEQVFTADTILHSASKVLMRGEEVIIGNNHIHKSCGIATTSECKHEGLGTHGEIKYEEISLNNPFPTSGAYYVSNDMNNIGEIVLTNDLYLCLNGNKITGVNFVGEGYTVYITSCEKENKIVSTQTKYLMNNGYLQILGGMSSINVEVDKLLSTTQNITREGSSAFYNVIMRPTSEETDYLIYSSIPRDVIISSVSITDYVLAEDKRLVNIALSGDDKATIKVINTKIENVKTASQVIFYFSRGIVLYKDNIVENVEAGHSIVWVTTYTEMTLEGTNIFKDNTVTTENPIFMTYAETSKTYNTGDLIFDHNKVANANILRLRYYAEFNNTGNIKFINGNEAKRIFAIGESGEGIVNFAGNLTMTRK